MAPAISSDGGLIAYASDRANGRLQIWVQATAGGDARRLTGDDAEERNPSFSADAAQVAFRSERDGGGIYVAAARGGEPRLVAGGGRNPRFSPDGRWIAYWVRESRPDRSRIFAIPTGGGEPRAICPQCSAASYPIWAPDSQRILFAGVYRDQRDWWVAPLAGGEPQQTGAYQIFGMNGFLRGSAAHGWARNAGPEDVFVRPAAWDGEIVLFSAALGANSEIWRIPLPATLGQVSGNARMVTSGGGWHFDPTVSASGRVVFARLGENVDVWAFALDAANGRSAGEPWRVAGGASREVLQSISRDGSKVVFQSDRSGRSAIWLHDLQTGKETMILESPRKAYLAPGGNRVAYFVGDELIVRPFASGEPVAFCRGCRPLSWFHDDNRLLVQIRGTDRLFMADTRQPKERREIVAVERPGRIMEASPSPDGKWIAFRALTPPSRSKVYIAPYRDSAPVERSGWIAIADEMSVSRSPEWSADGGLLYFLSERDGYLCIWAQRLERATKRPRGQPFPVQHFHNPQRTLRHDVSPDEIEFSVTGENLVLSVVEVSGNIWMLEE
jgi:Tol biopolymer transport system component